MFKSNIPEYMNTLNVGKSLENSTDVSLCIVHTNIQSLLHKAALPTEHYWRDLSNMATQLTGCTQRTVN